MFCLCLN
jgi:hypothetical protein